MALGRPRDFCTDEALDTALKLFWRKGYEGTSLTDLTKAMGINRPSLYAAFGNKASLFRKALDRYIEQKSALTEDAYNQPTARAGVEKLLYSLINVNEGECRGCMAVQAALVCGEASESIKQELADYRAASEERFKNRLQRAKDEGELPSHVDPADLARYVYTIIQGISVQSAGGATSEDLKKVIDLSLTAWPTN